MGIREQSIINHFEMRLREGTGAALAMGILIAALDLYREMATFAEASVSDKAEKQEEA
jgi:nicotinate-nucleotide--dimethylbenzimidazole phosphoribosyltransferase